MSFGARLHAAMADRGPLCVGIDPHPGLLADWGLSDSAAGVERFGRTVVEAVGEQVAVLKPQAAFFERHGAAGVAALERVLADGRVAGALMLSDIKRGDIGSTVAAYADGWLDRSSPLASDAVTASPYLGLGSLQPMIDTALRHDAGVFVLALTSNPEGPSVQRATTADGQTVAGAVLAGIAALNAGQQPLGSVGAVVGATIGSTEEDLDIGGPLLAPGLGAQGATAADLQRVFGAAVARVLPSMSREILRAGPDHGALQAATRRAIESFRQVLAPG